MQAGQPPGAACHRLGVPPGSLAHGLCISDAAKAHSDLHTIVVQRQNGVDASELGAHSVDSASRD